MGDSNSWLTDLTVCAMLLGNNIWKENILKIKLDLIVYFEKKNNSIVSIFSSEATKKLLILD